ncbi:uncharacterized protein LOC103519976 isoform X2 [Diaphorina citri]|uniref:Uncharacterized protein LOC103519976 isoform X1 n=1 Tax=Diaphorina citri TaxID=121845 RepID=A0A3Q0JF08_DIACI|nr:uncharacterized protein LOC103519976 isoform X1 [Diaphorina citri]XP_026687072.1 uncharacterized protein LOC103519976 isoform X2 [Diaphorina citri]
MFLSEMNKLISIFSLLVLVEAVTSGIPLTKPLTTPGTPYVNKEPNTLIQCVDENNNPVDWIIFYKLPRIHSSPNSLVVNGEAYMYVSSEDVKRFEEGKKKATEHKLNKRNKHEKLNGVDKKKGKYHRDHSHKSKKTGSHNHRFRYTRDIDELNRNSKPFSAQTFSNAIFFKRTLNLLMGSTTVQSSTKIPELALQIGDEHTLDQDLSGERSTFTSDFDWTLQSSDGVGRENDEGEAKGPFKDQASLMASIRAIELLSDVGHSKDTTKVNQQGDSLDDEKGNSLYNVVPVEDMDELGKYKYEFVNSVSDKAYVDENGDVPVSQYWNGDNIDDNNGENPKSRQERDKQSTVNTLQWTLSKYSVSDPASLPGKILSPYLFNASYAPEFSADGVKILYNDQTPIRTTVKFGHSKGLVVGNSRGGIWIVHSVPHFVDDSQTSYTYPHTGLMYGQNFLCLSLNASQLDSVGDNLGHNQIYKYSTFLSAGNKGVFPTLARVIAGEYATSGDNFFQSTIFTRFNQIPFHTFAKTRELGDDLYKRISDNLNVNLLVETWPNGPGRLRTDCESPAHEVMNVEGVALSGVVEFRSTHDHAKWTISFGNETRSSEKIPPIVGGKTRLSGRTGGKFTGKSTFKGTEGNFAGRGSLKQPTENDLQRAVEKFAQIHRKDVKTNNGFEEAFSRIEESVDQSRSEELSEELNRIVGVVSGKDLNTGEGPTSKPLGKSYSGAVVNGGELPSTVEDPISKDHLISAIKDSTPKYFENTDEARRFVYNEGNQDYTSKYRTNGGARHFVYGDINQDFTSKHKTDDEAKRFVYSKDLNQDSISKHKTDGARHFVCNGDINRAEDQLKRGGGSVCIDNEALWSLYHSIISAVEPCPRE